ncbi:class I SAM-dependent methyltransferase [Candidatus Pelagibacter bacterium nBUS_32]|uniref:class I SAM-dependent methyltransferase n=1 Tax=Candidatus Pelagibacter bacterium nBUS_32 TaxID=3374192 RepID=UPI003EB910BD
MKKKFLNLLKQPITNSYLSSINKRNTKNEYFYNLSVIFNTQNFLVSLSKPVDPKKQYTDKYAHRASQSFTMRQSFKSVANKLKSRFKPNFSMEIGSNDGVFLKNFKKNKIVAVEPCLNLAKITKKLGYKTYPNFWNRKLVNKILKEKSNFDLIYSANTISHIPNLKETFDAIYKSLNDNGVFVFEDPYMGSVIKMNSYDQFYDEHVHIFSLIAISNILKKSKLKVFDVELLQTHGGSTRFYVCKENAKFSINKSVKNLKSKELKQGLHKLSTYTKFASRVKKSKYELLELLKELKKKSKKVVSYGATYKSATIFNYCNIGNDLINYVLDSTKNKQGKFTPGKHILIKPSNNGIPEDVDYAFLGAWNFLKEIKKKEQKFLKRGGKFITHVPKIKIISL